MLSLLLLGAVSFLIALVATPLARDLAVRLRLVDPPGDARKLHSVPMPRIGGVPIAAAYLGAFTIALVFPMAAFAQIRSGLPEALPLMPAAAVVLLTGLIDDVRRLSPLQKLAGQLAAAGLAVNSGVRIASLADVPVDAWLAVPLTIVWLVACTNAFNLIDGVDGLAVGAGLFAAVTILLAALLQNNLPLAIATAPLAGALFGFLRYNFNPASVFLGDSGSLLIGFALGCFGVIWSQKCATMLGLTAPLMALAIPLLDTTLAVARRFVTRQPIFGADRGHIHHRLLDQGFTPRRVALMLYAACGVAATLALLTIALQERMAGPILVLFCIITWIGVQHLGYVEFGMAGRLLLDGALRRLVNSQLMLRGVDTALRQAATPDEVWSTLRDAAREFGFASVKLTLGDHRFSENFDPTADEDLWFVHMPVRGGSIELARANGSRPHSIGAAHFADTVQAALNSLPSLSEAEALTSDRAGIWREL